MDEWYEKSKSLLSSGETEECYKTLCKIIEACRPQRPNLLDSVTSRDGETVTERLRGQTLPDHQLADVYNTRGHIRYLWVDFNEAVEDYSKAIELDGRHGIAYYNRGQVHYRMGRYKEAEQDLIKTLQLMPDFEDARLNLNQVQMDIASGRQFNV